MILSQPPKNVCILRLSAIGDTCHTLPVVRTLQQAWPEAKFTWIIGKIEARLVGLVPEIEFLTFDKRRSLREMLRLRKLLRDREFDLLLHMHYSHRANLVSACVPARVKLGFDRERARGLQWMFTTHQIEARQREHVLDSLFGFPEALGIRERVLRWDIPLPEEAHQYAATIVTDSRPTLVINACSNVPLRNWRPEYYAEVADHAVKTHDTRVVLAGGPSAAERDMAEAIERAARQPLLNTVGKDTLPKFLALLQRSDALLSPDSGPIHMATAVRTPVIGLHAVTNPDRTGAYFSRDWAINKYDEAARKFMGRPGAELPWTKYIEKPGVMDLIQPAEVILKLDQLMSRKKNEMSKRS